MRYLFLFILCIPLFLNGQKLSPEKAGQMRILEMKILRNLKTIQPFEEIYQQRVNAKQLFLEFAKLDSSFYYPLDSLKEYVSLQYSDDQKVRTISWDLVSGGTWHDYAVLAQSFNQIIDMNQDSDSEYINYDDSGIFAIYDVQLNSQTFYLTFAYGTHGSGHHHNTVRVLYFDEGKLKEHPSFLNGKKEIIIVAARRDKTELIYDPISETIRHKEFDLEGEFGFAEATGKVIFYKLEKNGFVQK
ncbi:MAG: hypothetical protein KDC84_07800 [Crocinitomicaceae bacterium]|nr:hypothetical protein [Crocinitomicaceae bacterium]